MITYHLSGTNLGAMILSTEQKQTNLLSLKIYILLEGGMDIIYIEFPFLSLRYGN